MVLASSVAKRHEDKVARIARELRNHDASRPLTIRKKAAAHLVPKRDDLRHTDDKIDVGDLDEILDIDVRGRTCTAESGVTFEKLVAATLAHGLVPACVPELSTITVGGAVTGCSLESMSFRYGGFHDTCMAYEVVATDGAIFECTPDEHALAFQMMHGSFGTLGVLSKVTMKLVPAKPYVRMTYETYNRLDEYQEAIAHYFKRGNVDFVDGIIHARNQWVLSLGRFVDEAPYTNRYDWTKVYYKSTARRREDFLETPKYLFRYDRGVTNVHPKSAVGRLLFGRFMRSDRLLRLGEKLHRVLPERPGVTVDLFLPFSRLEEFFTWYRERIDFYPLWCVPYKRVRDYEWIADGYFDDVRDALFVDLAIYGLDQPEGRNLYAELEEELLRLHGIKTLISYNYYDEDTFWQTWNKANHFEAKRMLDPRGVFRDLYSKTCLAPRGITRSPQRIERSVRASNGARPSASLSK